MQRIWNRIHEKPLPEVDGEKLFVSMSDGYDSKTGDPIYSVLQIIRLDERWHYTNGVRVYDSDLASINTWCLYSDMLKQALEPFLEAKTLVSRSGKPQFDFDELHLEEEPDGC